MKKINNLKDFCKKYYLRYDEFITYDNIAQYIVENNDKLFTVYGSAYYFLSQQEFKFKCENNHFYIMNENKDFLSDYKKIIKINSIDPQNLLLKTIEEKLVISYKEREVYKEFEVGPYVFKDHKPENNIELVNEKVVIKLKHFNSEFFLKNERMLNKKSVCFDLTECTGGSFLNMLGVISLLSNRDLIINLLNNRGELKEIFIKGKNYFNKIEEIDFIISSKTASSAEIFLAYVSSIFPGKIIGDKTFGKNQIQTLINYENYFVSVPIFEAVYPKEFYNNHVVRNNIIYPDYYNR